MALKKKLHSYGFSSSVSKTLIGRNQILKVEYILLLSKLFPIYCISPPYFCMDTPYFWIKGILEAGILMYFEYSRVVLGLVFREKRLKMIYDWRK